ncbi:hypothetical protein OV079_49540 [Nannocystis pusilla]|uniref:Uncharacterized protein n=1 Tax=Nannocystis pusilla TaxID=889268 RepID=A0A9X3F7Z4_9BACT|nr:hypothetical protein [Nannocystis pusilla]
MASQVACAHGAREIARGGVEGGLEGTLEALEDEDNRARLRRLLRDPEIQAAVHDLTQSITGGALDGLTDEERIQRVGEASDRYIRTISGALARAVGEDVSPAVTKSVKELVGAVMAGAIGPENRRLTREFVDGVTRTALSAFMQSTAQGLREELGPALGDVVTQDLGPAVQRVVEDNLGPALRTVLERDLGPTMLAVAGGEDGGAVGAFGRALSKQLVLGVNDGMSELGISLSPNKKASMGIFGWLAIGLGIVLLLVTILLVRELFGRRAQARERAQRGAAAQHPGGGAKPRSREPGRATRLRHGGGAGAATHGRTRQRGLVPGGDGGALQAAAARGEEIVGVEVARGVSRGAAALIGEPDPEGGGAARARDKPRRLVVGS